MKPSSEETVLVTGADGFVGRHLVLALRDEGVRVRSLDLAFEDGPEGAERVVANVLDVEAVARSMGGVDTVFHLAAISDLWAADGHDRVNVEGTRTVLEAAVATGARRFVHCSSNVTLLDGSRRPRRIDEETRPVRRNLLGSYARSKRDGENLVAAASGRIETIVVHPGTPIGPGDHRPTPPGRFLRDVAGGAIPALPRKGWLNVVDVRALARAIARARHDAPAGSRYLLTGEDITIGRLARAAAAAAGRRAPREVVPQAVAWTAAFAQDRLWSKVTGRRPTASLDGLRMSTCERVFDNGKARRDLGLEDTDVERCVSQAVEWMAANDMIRTSGREELR